ncbi:MAG: aspartate/glutamate racemase family protein [Candidatus Aminicenantales bacterium]
MGKTRDKTTGKTIGILGGMGPEATIYFYELIIRHTKAHCDQNHIKTIIYSNPKIPPRTDAILKKGESPLPHLKEGIEILTKAGVDFIIMPCVTAHYYYEELAGWAKIPVVSLLEESLHFTKKNFPHLSRAGLLASTGTVESRLFHKTFAREAVEIITPLEEEQTLVMDAIFGRKGIKAGFTSGYPREIILSSASRLIGQGAEAIIAGCTEISLVLKKKDISVPFIDPLYITALSCIRKAGYKIELKGRIAT